MATEVDQREVTAFRESLEALSLKRPRPSGVEFVELCGGEYDGCLYPVPHAVRDEEHLGVPVDRGARMLAVYLKIGRRASYLGIRPHPRLLEKAAQHDEPAVPS